ADLSLTHHKYPPKRTARSEDGPPGGAEITASTVNFESDFPDARGNQTPRPRLHSRTQLLLHGPIVPTLLTLAWPNLLIMVAQASTGLIETYFVAKLGTAALAGMAVVFPAVMLMQMVSAGAMGGGISSAIARAL